MLIYKVAAPFILSVFCILIYSSFMTLQSPFFIRFSYTSTLPPTFIVSIVPIVL
ncbi:hypothetical protein F4776DRAFT_647196 [Hypoxylon sp. NC0597]|nr:hypothetical protein F4776DRAFT_647196 [Hypoxylon sp. NC0597]